MLHDFDFLKKLRLLKMEVIVLLAPVFLVFICEYNLCKLLKRVAFEIRFHNRDNDFSKMKESVQKLL